MQYIVQGYNPKAQQWETLKYQTEVDGEDVVMQRKVAHKKASSPTLSD